MEALKPTMRDTLYGSIDKLTMRDTLYGSFDKPTIEGHTVWKL